MAWVRTATSLISFGFTIDKMFGLLRQQQSGPSPSAIGARTFALMLIAIGLSALMLAAVQHRRDLKALRELRPGAVFAGGGCRGAGWRTGRAGLGQRAAAVLTPQVRVAGDKPWDSRNW